MLAIDYGTVRLGLAISDPGQQFAGPYENYTRVSRSHDALYLRRVVTDERVVEIVVGLPVHLDGRESPKSEEARRFGAWVAETTGCPVRYFDERFTSVEAEQQLMAAKLTSKKRKQRRDMLAAQLLLAAYLESDRSLAHEHPDSLDG